MFHCNPSIRGYPHLWKPAYWPCLISCQWWSQGPRGTNHVCRKMVISSAEIHGASFHNSYWLVVWLPFFIFPYIGNNHPNWLTHIFQSGPGPPTRLDDRKLREESVMRMVDFNNRWWHMKLTHYIMIKTDYDNSSTGVRSNLFQSSKVSMLRWCPPSEFDTEVGTPGETHCSSHGPCATSSVAGQWLPKGELIRGWHEKSRLLWILGFSLRNREFSNSFCGFLTEYMDKALVKGRLMGDFLARNVLFPTGGWNLSSPLARCFLCPKLQRLSVWDSFNPKIYVERPIPRCSPCPLLGNSMGDHLHNMEKIWKNWTYPIFWKTCCVCVCISFAGYLRLTSSCWTFVMGIAWGIVQPCLFFRHFWEIHV